MLILSELISEYMLTMPDGSTVVSTQEQINELKSLPEDQREARLQEMEATRDEGGPHDYAN